jgi:RNA polymerase-binding transcription factor DksA
MDEQLIKENKAKLLLEQDRIRKILGNEGTFEGKGEFPGDYKPKFPAVGDDEDDNALEVELYETNTVVIRDLEIKLKKIEASLKRIEDGTYGKCLQGDEIEPERLRAVPEADTCVKHSK